MKFCIVGGRGRMGRLFEKIFTSKGHEVSIIGRGNYEELKKKVNDADITIISVPLSSASEVVRDIAGVISSEKLAVDFSSVMKGNLDAMRSMPCPCAFVHPLFGPDIDSLKNLNFITVPVRKGGRLEWFLNFLREEDSKIIHSTVEEHDRIMALVQGLAHFTSILFAKTLINKSPEEGKAEEFSTTLFRLKKNVLWKIFSQSSDMIANIQFKNDEFRELLKSHRKDFEELYDIVIHKDKEAFGRIFKEIAGRLQSKRMSRRVRVKKPVRNWDKEAIAVLGPAGSFTDAAYEFYLQKAGGSRKKVFVDTIPGIIIAVKEDRVKKGVIPIENSLQGTITETLDGISQNNLKIEKEIILPVHHCCAALSRNPPVERLFSHPQAFLQCSRFIRENYPEAKEISTLSTSEAFQIIKENELNDSLAIGPEIAAEKYGLKIVKRDIEDEKNNKTKFVAVSKNSCKDRGASGGNLKTSIAVYPFHERQGILFKLLSFFNDEKINLTKIESRPMKDELGRYIFYIDLDGSVTDEGVKRSLAGIRKEVGEVKMMGCYGMIVCSRDDLQKQAERGH